MNTCLAIALAMLALSGATRDGGSPVHPAGPISRAEVVAAKRGSIIEAQTKAPIEGVRVVATYYKTGLNNAGTFGGCVLSQEVATDEKGNYFIPDVADNPFLQGLSLGSAVRSLSPNNWHSPDSFSWHIMTFKAGYVRADDARELPKALSPGRSFSWEGFPPPVSNGFGERQIAPIVLQKSELSATETILYLSRQLRFFRSCDATPRQADSAELTELVREIHAMVRPIPCSMPEQAAIPKDVAAAFSFLNGGGDSDREAFFRFGGGRADTFGKRMDDALRRGGGYDWTDTNAGTLCWAQGKREARP